MLCHWAHARDQLDQPCAEQYCSAVQLNVIVPKVLPVTSQIRCANAAGIMPTLLFHVPCLTMQRQATLMKQLCVLLQVSDNRPTVPAIGHRIVHTQQVQPPVGMLTPRLRVRSERN